MRSLAIKHREYILRYSKERTASDGAINTQLREAYIRETGESVSGCGSCFMNTVLPKYVRLLKEIDNESK